MTAIQVSRWRLEGAALDRTRQGPDQGADPDSTRRVVVIGPLDPLLRIIRMPGFQLYALQRDPQPRQPVEH